MRSASAIAHTGPTSAPQAAASSGVGGGALARDGEARQQRLRTAGNPDEQHEHQQEDDGADAVAVVEEAVGRAVGDDVGGLLGRQRQVQHRRLEPLAALERGERPELERVHAVVDGEQRRVVSPTIGSERVPRVLPSVATSTIQTAVPIAVVTSRTRPSGLSTARTAEPWRGPAARPGRRGRPWPAPRARCP